MAQAVAEWAATHDDPVTLVFDGRPEATVAERGGGNLTVDFARRAGRDAADDRIVEVVDAGYADGPDLTVVTSDRGLAARLPPGVAVEGAGRVSVSGSACPARARADHAVVRVAAERRRWGTMVAVNARAPSPNVV